MQLNRVKSQSADASNLVQLILNIHSGDYMDGDDDLSEEELLIR